MGQETFLRVGIDGTQAQSGERVVVRSLDNISKGAETVTKHVEYLQSALTHLAGTAIGVYGIATALQAIKNNSIAVLQYLGKIETATLGIASAFLVSGQYQDKITKKALDGQSALKAAQRESAAVIEQLKVANFQTIATLDQLIFAYQVTLPVAMSAGFNKKQVMDYTLAMVQAAGAIGLSFDQIAEETRSVLTGNITRNSRIAQVLGITNSDISGLKGNAGQLFDFLMKRLEGFRLAGIEAQKTWAGLLSNTKDIALQLAGKSFEPVFEAVKAKLLEVQNSVFKISKDSNGIQSIKFSPEFLEQAKQASEYLTKFTTGLIDSATFIYKHAGAIKDLVEIYIGFRLTILASSAAQKIVNAVNLEAMAIENGRRALAVQALATSAEQAQATLTEASAEVTKHTAMKNSLSAQIEAQRFNIANIELQKQSASAKVRDIEAEQAKIAARRASLQAHMETIAAETAALNEKYAVSKNVLEKEVADNVSSSNTIKQTWREFVAERMSDYMKLEGGHAAAMKRMSVEWQAYKAAAVEAVTEVKAVSSNMVVAPTMSKKDENFSKELRNSEWNTRNALIAAEKEEELMLARLSAAQAKEVALSEQLRQAKYRVNGAITEQMAAEAGLVTALEAEAIAAKNATLASDKHNVAAMAASMSSRAAAGASSFLSSALMYLGGPIGAIITLLGVAATAWFVFGDNAKKANEKALNGADDVLESLRKQNKELKERQRLQEATKVDNPKGESLFTDKELEHYNELLKKKSEIEAQLKKLPDFQIKEVDTRKITATAQNTVSALKISLSQITSQINEMKRLKEENKKLEEGTKYKPNDPKKPEDNTLKASQSAREALNRLMDAENARELAKIKDQTKAQEDALESRHHLQLISEQQFIDQKFAIQKDGIQKELAQIKDREDKALQDVANAKAKLNTGKAAKGQTSPEKANLELAADYSRVQTELVKIQEKRESLERSLGATQQKYGQETLSNIKAQKKAYSDVAAQLQEMSGNQAGAEHIRQKQSLDDLETSKREMQAVLKTGPQRIAFYQQMLSLENQITLVKDAGLQTDYNLVAQQEEMKAQILDELGLLTEAFSVRKAIKDINPATVNKDPELKALEDKLDALKKIKVAYDELHKNDDLKDAIATGNPWMNDPDKEIEQIDQKYKHEIEWLDYLSERRELSAKEQERYWLLEKSRAQELTASKKKQLETQVAATSNAIGQIGEAMMQGNKQQFEAGKGMMMAQATISAALAIVQCYAQLGPIAGTVAAVGVGIATAVQIAKIADTEYEARQTGGNVNAGGTYLVGEAGPELIRMGGTGGTVIPNNALAQAGEKQLEATKQNTEAIKNLASGFHEIKGAMKETLQYIDGSGTHNRLSGIGQSLESEGYLQKTLNAISTAVVGPFNSTMALLRGDFKGSLQGAVDYFLGGWGGNVFGGKKTINSAGVTMGYSNGGVDSKNYTYIKTDGGWFGKDKYTAIFSDVDKGLQTAFNNISNNIKTSIKTAGSALGGITVDLEKFAYAAKPIDLRGKTAEQANQLVEAWFNGLADAMTGKLGGPEAQAELAAATHYGETSYAALMRLTMSLQAVQDAATDMGGVMIQSSIKSAAAASDLIDSFGGLDKYLTAIDDYNQVVSSDNEYKTIKLAEAQRTITNALSDQLDVIPQTVEEYKKLVQQTDPSSPLYATLIGLSSAFGAVKDSSEALQDQINRQSQLNLDLIGRTLKAQGQSDAAEVFSLQRRQQEELAEAQKEGLDVSQLLTVQTLEYNAAIASLTKTLEDGKRDFSNNVQVRGLKAGAQDTNLAELVNMLISQEKELSTAREKGFDVTQLLVVQEKEYNAQLKTIQDAAKNKVQEAQIAFNELASSAEAKLHDAQIAFNELVANATKSVSTAQEAYDKAVEAREKQTRIDSLNNQLKAAQDVSSAWKSVSQSIKSAITSLTSGQLAVLGPLAKLKFTRSEFEITRKAALGGNSEAGEKLGSLGTDYADAAQATASSKLDYLREYSKIMSGLSEVDNAATSKTSKADVQINLLQSMLDALNKNDDKSVEDALESLNTAKAQLKVLTDLGLATTEAKETDAETAANALITAKAQLQEIVALGLKTDATRESDAATAAKALTTAQAEYDTALKLQASVDAQMLIAQANATQAHEDALGIIGAIQAQIDEVRTSSVSSVSAGALISSFKLPEVNNGISLDVPSFDVGSSGLPYDMTARVHADEKIIDPQTSRFLDRYGIQVHTDAGSSSNRDEEMLAKMEAMVRRLEQLEQSVQIGLAAIAKHTRKTSETVDRWEGGGMPETRSVA